MSVLEKLNDVNKGTTIYRLDDQRFGMYGRVFKNLCAEPVMSYLKENAVAKEKQVYYDPSIGEMEVESRFKDYVKNNVFGGLDIEIGWCYGWCNRMNGLEYHMGSEVIVAATELVLLLGRAEDIDFTDGKAVYDSSKVEAFYVEGGTVLELYTKTLHFAPIQVRNDRQFTAGIILPKDTNLPLDYTPEQDGEGILLANINKWLITHPEMGSGYMGIVGDNIEIKML